ncbi:MAG: hypothetical protein WAV56_01215 [Microgenomates group bacterium]
MKEIIDHRTVRSDISVGGTDRLFELEAIDAYGFRARVGDDRGDIAAVEALYNGESLFKVIYPGLEIYYDYAGNLQRLVMALAAFYESLPVEIFEQLGLTTAAAVKFLSEHGADFVVEVDLADGLVLGDMSGWLQIIPNERKLKKIDGGIGGREIRAGAELRPFTIEVNDEEGVPVGKVYLTLGLQDDILLLGVGDGRIRVEKKYHRLVDPDWLELAKSPIGALSLLIALQDRSE